jgi:hypothetical protein
MPSNLRAASDITIYLDPADEDKIQRLALHHGVDLNIRVSDVSFIGGTRAVIPAKECPDRQFLRHEDRRSKDRISILKRRVADHE